MFIFLILGVIAAGTFAYSIYGVLTDECVVWEQMDWRPTWPYGYAEPKPDVDPNIVTEHLFENNNPHEQSYRTIRRRRP